MDIKENTKKPQRGMEFPTVNQMMVLSEVHAHGGFAKASRAMGTPDSYAKVTVSKLEKKLGVKLTAPTGRGRVIPLSRGVADHLIKKAINTFDVFETYWGVDRPNVNVLPFRRNGNLCYELTHNKSGSVIHLETRSNGGIFFRVKDNLDRIDGKSAKDVYDSISQFVEDGTLPEKINLSETGLSFDGFMEDFWEKYISPICRNYKLQNSFLSHPEGHKSFFKKEDGYKRSLNIDLTAPKDEEKLVKFSVSFKRSSESGKWISAFDVADFWVPLNEAYLFDLYKNVIEFFNNASGYDKDIDVSINLENSLREFAHNCWYIDSFDIPTGEYECTNENGNVIWRRT